MTNPAQPQPNTKTPEPPANEQMMMPEDVVDPEQAFAEALDAINEKHIEQGLPDMYGDDSFPVSGEPDQYGPLREALISGDDSALRELEIQAMGENIELQPSEGSAPATDLQPEVDSDPVEVNGTPASSLMDDAVNMAVGVFGAAMYGIGAGVQEATRTGIALTGVDSPIPTAQFSRMLKHAIARNVFGVEADQALYRQEAQLRQFDNTFSENLVNMAEVLGVPEPDTVLDEIVATITPTLISGLAGTRAIQGLKVSSILSGAQLPGWLGKTVGSKAGSRVLEAATMLLAEGAAIGASLPADLDNFADMLDEVSGSDDGPLGMAARAWLKGVPGVESLVKNETDDDLTKKFKNALDVAYGGVVAPIAFMAFRNRKVLGQIVRGVKSGKMTIEEARPALQEVADDARIVEAVGQKLDEAMSSPEALDAISRPADGGGTLDDLASEVNGTPASKTPEPELDTTPLPMDNEPADITASVSASAEPSNESFIDATRRNVTQMLGMDKAELVKRIEEARAISEAAEADWLGNMTAATNRYNTMAKEAGKVPLSAKFDAEGFAAGLKEAFDSDNDQAVIRAVRQWADYMDYADGEIPALLSPDQISKWADTPMDVTGPLVAQVKRLTTTNAKRVEMAEAALAQLMGDGSDPAFRKASRALLKGTAKATADVDRSSQLMLMNGMYAQTHVVPALEQVSRMVRENPTDEMALGVLKAVQSKAAAIEEANKNLKSAYGRGLQGAQIEPEAAEALRKAYGATEYDRLYNPGAKNVEPSFDIVPELDLTVSETDRKVLKSFADKFGYVQPDRKMEVASSMFQAGQHPWFKAVGQNAKFTTQLASDLMMSYMLYHPSTWGRVFTGAAVGMGADSIAQGLGAAALQGFRKPVTNLIMRDVDTLVEREGKLFQMVFKGTPITQDAYQAVMFKASVRLSHVPHAWGVMGRSFVRPGWQGVLNLGHSLIGNQNMLGPERFAQAFGEDVATRVFTGKGTVRERLLLGAGSGLGFPAHVLGAIESGINSNAIVGNVAETLWLMASSQGLKGMDRLKFIERHANDVIQDALVAKVVSRGNVPLKNTANIDMDTLRGIVERSSDDADFSSLRARDLRAETGLATTKYRDRVIPKALKTLESGMNMPMAGPVIKAIGLPFGSVILNMVDRALLPIQASLAIGSRAAGMPGLGGKYMDEVISGLHGPTRQAEALGYMFLAGGVAAGAALNMSWELNRNRTFGFPLGDSARGQAGRERDARFDDVYGVGGSTFNVAGFEPLASYWKAGSYATWIVNEYKDIPTGPRGSSLQQEASEHVLQMMGELAPASNLMQGVINMLGSFAGPDKTEGGALKAFMGGLGAGLGSMAKRPASMVDLLPGKQHAGRHSTIKDQGFGKAFMTAGGGFQMGPNRNRITVYDIAGNPVRDKYDPSGGPDEYLEALGLPAEIPYETNPYNRFLAELENHGITLPTLERKQQLEFKPGLTETVDLQNWYNEKTKESLWDVYNRLLREKRVISHVQRSSDRKLTVQQAMDEIAEIHLPDELDMEQNSYIYRKDSDKKLLSVGAAKLQEFIQTIRNGNEFEKGIKAELEAYMVKHLEDFTNDSGDTLKFFIEEVEKSKYEVVPTPLKETQDKLHGHIEINQSEAGI